MADMDTWLADKVARIKGLNHPSEVQAKLVELYEKEQRTARDERLMAAIIRAEKATDRAEKARREAAKFIREPRNKKARDRMLILLGTVVEDCIKTNKWPTLPPKEALDAKLTRKHDRAVFDLPPLPENAPDGL